MHVFLTGVPGSGKSTLINQALLQLNQPSLGGFRTVSVPMEGSLNLNVHIIAPCGVEQYHENNLVGIRYPGREFSSFPAAFDNYGASLVEASEDARLILMDELGIMENEAQRFQAAVLAKLDQNTPILGAVKPFSTPFLDKIKQHPQVKIIAVDKTNRDHLLPQILAELNLK